MEDPTPSRLSTPPLPGIKLFNLTGRTALITGGSKGLGLAMAAGLASAGAEVMLVSRHPNEAQAAAEQVAHDFKCRAFAHAADVTLPADVDGMLTAAENALGKVDILINSAGINIRGPITQLTLEQFTQVMTTNVTATWLCCRAVVSGMRARKWGRIINMASALGLIGIAGRTPYTASKGAVIQMTRTLALETAADGITVNAICPGPFLTEINRPVASSEEFQRTVINAIALKRWARLEEIQGAAIFLASDAASYVTGSTLTVDGGWTAQ
ncbi:MAG TPA: SDR family oxidoreductase [Verrucomicrobiota bacterium]|nr:2-deoxy-D-gluconate 3-dehydrogenase [Verrucomicrobiales bacterium]HRI11814.1 SDR family oxidoreductase [Verrucomicrobiota bacterium]